MFDEPFDGWKPTTQINQQPATWGLNQGTTEFAYNSNRQRVVKWTEEPGTTNTMLYVHGLSAQRLSETHCINFIFRNEC